jgi:hypothetical protein
MIEIYIDGENIKALGLVPSQAIKVHVNKKIYLVTRFGSTCIGRCYEEKEEV